jgi:hypothetical protein
VATSIPPVNAFAASGHNPLNFVSQPKGSLHSGVLPGQSATVDYSWLNVPGVVITGVTATAYLGVVDYSFGIVQGELKGSVLIPRTTTPEPPTSGLGAFALCLFALCAWRRQQHRRIRAWPIH